MTKIIVKEAIYIAIVTIVPLIILWIAIAKSKKNRKVVITIVGILIIAIYAIFAKSLIYSAERIVHTISVQDKKSEDIGTDITYLKNYKEKMGKTGYITKWDVEQIINITDAKSKLISIKYKDQDENIDITVSNKEDEKIKDLKELLKAEYYKFDYKIDDDKEITINIERYVLEND